MYVVTFPVTQVQIAHTDHTQACCLFWALSGLLPTCHTALFPEGFTCIKQASCQVKAPVLLGIGASELLPAFQACI